jgi:Tfp pilus assembly protein PilV
MTIRTTRLSQGFALLEALIAAGVLGFGLLGVARLQITVLGNSDLAKQRSEAVQLGEQKIEELRSFSRAATYQDIGSSSDTVSGTSAAFTRAWTIADSAVTVVGGTYPIYKDVKVSVSWTSRSNTGESVDLSSIIAMSEPAAAGQAAVPPAGTPTRKPKNRAINIPWPALTLGGGASAFHPPGSASGFAILLNDKTGAVTGTCATATLPGSDNTSGTPTVTTGWGCTSVNGLLLTGYIGLPGNNPPPVNFHISVHPTPNTSVTGTAALVGCYDDIGPSGTLAQAYAGYVSYACVIDVGNSNGAWSGTTTFSGQTFASPPVTVAWGTTAGKWKVGRYAPNGSAYPYADVKTGLENQNYVLRTGTASFPSGTVQSFP